MKDYSSKTGGSHSKDSCNLTAITYSPIGMKKDWKRFIKELDMPARFLNRNEFSSEVGTGLTTFPTILVQVGKDILQVASTDEINRCQCLEDLMNLVQQRVASIG
ncbi:hypothetical protein [Methanoregula sp.]|uniref:hypothetical protein n=1 Tax=Methanoregula sp. TaxID=2052170 RepID=UPI0023710214|nr:hypothetical protein [Methanoregula sp.]MDD1686797.1 hypothetical protein [Methanoregula sp.]